MIINAETLKNLKQINVSADKEKTISRVKQLWAKTPVSTKKQVLSTVKTGDATIYRVFRTGTITPRIVLALASSLNANPFYLTGDADEDTGYTPDMPELFLEAKGIGERRGGKRLKGYAIQADAEKAASAAPGSGEAFAGLGEDEYVLQLRALFHRAAFSANAKARLRAIADVLFQD